MADRFIFQLAEGWALGADDNQWMLLRGRKRHAETIWQPAAFIASTKTNLLLCMAEKPAGSLLMREQSWMNCLSVS